MKHHVNFLHSPRQIITTKWIPHTDTRGARFRASADAGSITIPEDHNLNSDENHAKACRMLVEKLCWDFGGTWSGGFLKNTCVWIWSEEP